MPSKARHGSSVDQTEDKDKIVARIRFEFDGIERTIEVEAAPGLQPTLLAIARDHRIPLLSNCEAGACGACIVEIEAADCRLADMTEAEAFFLRVIGKAEEDGDGGVRLACQYRPRPEEDVRVRFASALCSF